MNKAAMSIVEQVSLWYGRPSFGYIPRSDRTGSFEVGQFPFPVSHHIDFQNGKKKILMIVIKLLPERLHPTTYGNSCRDPQLNIRREG